MINEGSITYNANKCITCFPERKDAKLPLRDIVCKLCGTCKPCHNKGWHTMLAKYEAKKEPLTPTPPLLTPKKKPKNPKQLKLVGGV